MTQELTPFDVYQPGTYLHGTKADSSPGDLLTPEHPSNYEASQIARHVYFSETLDAAAWGAELAEGETPGRTYIVEPTGAIEDDPNVTDKRFPGNPTRFYRTREPLRVLSELTEWTGHIPEQIQTMRDGLDELRRQGAATILD